MNKSILEKQLASFQASSADSRGQIVLDLGLKLGIELRKYLTREPEDLIPLLELSAKIDQAASFLLDQDKVESTQHLSDFFHTMGNSAALLRLPIRHETYCSEVLNRGRLTEDSGHWYFEQLDQIFLDPWSIYNLIQLNHKKLAEKCFARFEETSREWYTSACERALKESSKDEAWRFDEFDQGMTQDLVVSNLHSFFKKDPVVQMKLDIFSFYPSIESIQSFGAPMKPGLDVQQNKIDRDLRGPSINDLRYEVLKCWKDLRPSAHLRFAFHQMAPLSVLEM